MSKLLSYEFLVEYKQGKDDKVADALSRSCEEEVVKGKEVFTLYVITPFFVCFY